MKGIFFEEKGEELLCQLGITKAEFARLMGIQRQNVKALFKTNNIEIIARVAHVLEVPFALLISYVEEPDLSGQTYEILLDEIRPEDIPSGDSPEDRRIRNRLIRLFYLQWLNKHREKKVFNKSLNDFIYVKYVSINETAGHASLRYLSTLAVLQLDAILPNAVLKSSKPIKQNTRNQKSFKKMLVMEYTCPGIGLVRLTVGQKSSDGTKVQYCITAITACS